MRAKIGEVKLQNNLLSLIGNWSKRKDIRALEILHGEKIAPVKYPVQM